MQRKCIKCIWLLIMIIGFAWIAPPGLAAKKQTSKSKVAIVNGSVITQADLDRELNRARQRLTRMGKSLNDSQLLALKKEALEGLINSELLYQESQRKGIKVKEVAINEQLKSLKERFSTEDKFRSALIKANLTEAGLRSQIKKGLAAERFIIKYFVEKITISGKEVRAYYDTHPDSFKQPERVRASHILIKFDPQGSKSQRAEALKKIKEIQKKVRKGEDFASLAKASSQCPSSTKGGDLGYFKRRQMVRPFEEAAFALKPGQVSDPVETMFGYHLIKVIDKKPETKIPYKDIKERTEKYLKDKQVHKEVNLYVEKLKENAKVEKFLSEPLK